MCCGAGAWSRAEYRGAELVRHASGLCGFVVMWYRPGERGSMVPWNEAGARRVVELGTRESGLVNWLG